MTSYMLWTDMEKCCRWCGGQQGSATNDIRMHMGQLLCVDVLHTLRLRHATATMLRIIR
jgi:hypothetical protein